MSVRRSRGFALLGALAALAAGALAAPARADGAGAAAPQPRIVFAAKLHDLGRLVMGREAKHTYRFKNDGAADLAIRRVKPACGCTAALVSHKVVPPGGEGAIEVTFDSKDRHGFQELQVQVVTNDPLERDAGDFTSILSLRVEVVTVLDVLPMTIYFASFRRGVEQAREVTVLPRTAGAALAVTAVEPSVPWLAASVTPHEAGGRRGARVRVAAKADAPLGRIDEHVLIRTDHADQPVVRVPIIGAIHGDLIAFPDRLALAPRAGESGEALIIVKRLAGEGPIRLVRVEPPPFLDAAIDELIPGNQTEVLLKTRPGLAPGSYAGEVRLHLHHAELPLVAVPLTLIVPPRVRVEPLAAWFDAAAPAPARVLVDVPDGHRVTSVPAPARLAGGAWLEVPPPAWLGELEPGGTRSEALIIETDVPGEERVVIPLVGARP